MNSELQDLYQEVVLDHSRKPRNFRKLEGSVQSAEGFNPLCGDQVTVYVQVDGDKIKDIGFQGSGCAISKASASLMTAAVKDKSPAEANRLFDQFHTLVTKGPTALTDISGLGKLAALSGVWEFPVRVKCASLAWHTLRAALKGERQPVSTE
jgi:nitrogen fixation NifU-like protein